MLVTLAALSLRILLGLVNEILFIGDRYLKLRIRNVWGCSSTGRALDLKPYYKKIIKKRTA